MASNSNGCPVKRLRITIGLLPSRPLMAVAVQLPKDPSNVAVIRRAPLSNCILITIVLPANRTLLALDTPMLPPSGAVSMAL